MQDPVPSWKSGFPRLPNNIAFCSIFYPSTSLAPDETIPARVYRVVLDHMTSSTPTTTMCNRMFISLSRVECWASMYQSWLIVDFANDQYQKGIIVGLQLNLAPRYPLRGLSEKWCKSVVFNLSSLWYLASLIPSIPSSLPTIHFLNTYSILQVIKNWTVNKCWGIRAWKGWKLGVWEPSTCMSPVEVFTTTIIKCAWSLDPSLLRLLINWFSRVKGQIAPNCSWFVDFSSLEVTLIPWSVPQKVLITRFNFDPGRKHF